MKNFASILTLLFVISNASADALRSFSDGAIAKADDVNHNFEHLDARITELISRIESPEASEIVSCDSNPDALQQAIEEARGLSSILNISATGDCNRINIANQQVSISNAGSLTINNVGGSDSTAPTVTVRDAGVLSISGFPAIDGGANTAISIYGQSYFLGAYLQIIGGSGGIVASWSNFILLGNATFTDVGTAMVLNSSTGLFLGQLSGTVFPCGGQGNAPACLSISSSNAYSSAFSLNNSRLALGSENTTVIIQTTEASIENHSSLGLRNGSLGFTEELQIEGASVITATGSSGENLIINSDVQLTENSIANLDYDNIDDGVGEIQINGNVEVNLGAVLNVNGSSEIGVSKVLLKENLTVLAGAAVLTDTQMQLGTSQAPAEINVIGGQLFMDGQTFDKLPSPSTNGSNADITVIHGGSFTITHDNAAAPTPTCSEIGQRVSTSFDGSTYYLNFFEAVGYAPHDYGEYCNGG